MEIFFRFIEMRTECCYCLTVCCDVYVVSQAPTVEVKMAWLNELRRILTNQQKLLRGLRTTEVNFGHKL